MFVQTDKTEKKKKKKDKWKMTQMIFIDARCENANGIPKSFLFMFDHASYMPTIPFHLSMAQQ